MWKPLLLLMLAVPAYADVIPITAIQFAIPQDKIAVPLKGDVDFFSPALNGVPAQGQQVSLDLLLADDALARMQIAGEIGFGVRFFTTAGPFQGGWATNVTAYLIDHDFQHVPVQWAAGGGGGATNDGSFHAGAHSLNYATPTPFLFRGFHFDMTFPNTDATITNTRMRWNVANAEFGTIQQLPEGSTVGMVLAGLTLLTAGLFLRESRRRAGPKPTA